MHSKMYQKSVALSSDLIGYVPDFNRVCSDVCQAVFLPIHNRQQQELTKGM